MPQPRPSREDVRDISLRRVLVLAWPILVSMLSYTIMSLADALYVGQLGTEPLAAVGLAGIFSFVLVSFGLGMSGGIKVLISHAYGADDEDESKRLAWQGIWLSLGLSLVALALTPLGPLLFAQVAEEPGVVSGASDYFVIRVLGAPFFYVTAAMGAYFQGRGDTQTPMRATLVGNLLNVGFNPIFIFGLGPVPGLGLAGAAWASLLSEFLIFAILARRYWMAVPERPPRPQWSKIAEIWRIGAPMGVRWVLETASFMVFTSMLATVGATHLAAHTMVVRIISVSFMPGHAIAESGSILAGQSLGASYRDGVFKAHRLTTGVALALMMACGLAFLLLPGALLAPFNPSLEVAALATQLLFIAAVFQLFDAFAMVTGAILNGIGDTRYTMWVSILLAWFFEVPLGYFLGIELGYGAPGIWTAACARLVIMAAVLVWRLQAFRSGRYQTSLSNKVIAQSVS